MRYLLACLCLFALASCTAQTQLSGVTDPAYQGAFQTKSMVVLAPSMSIAEQKRLEAALSKALRKHDVRLLGGLALFPPTRDFSEAQIHQRIHQEGADTLLRFDVERRARTSTYIPPSYHPGDTESRIRQEGERLLVETETSAGYVSGGYSLETPLIDVSVRLQDASSARTIWIGQATSDGMEFLTYADLIAKIAQKTAQALIAEGLIAPKAPAN